MGKYIFGWMILMMNVGLTFAQESDKILLSIELDTIHRELIVEQELRLINHSNKTLKEVYLHAWANAYSGRVTTLNETKLQDRKGNLHFSENEDRGGIRDLTLENLSGEILSYKTIEREFIQIPLDKPWRKGAQIVLKAKYIVKIPFDAVTKYGRKENGDYLLKYFFLEAATLDEKSNFVLQHYKDFESLAAYPSTYSVEIQVPDEYSIWSDLEQNGNRWQGTKLEHFRLYLTKHANYVHTFIDPNSGLEVDFGYAYDSINAPIVDSLLPSQIQFLENHLGKFPSDKLFISAKTKKEQNYFGVDDLDIWIKEVELFDKEEKNALKLFQILSYEYIDRLFTVNKQQDHWIKNGLQFYLLMKYVDQNFPEMKLAGKLPDAVSFLGIKPLKFFHISKVEMNDRYKLLYLYLARQNYDQPINTPFDELSNLNQIAISGFKTGLSFYYIDAYLGEGVLHKVLKDFFVENSCCLVSQLDFRNHLIENSPKDLSWLFDDYIDRKDKINFKLVSIKENEEDITVRIKNATQFAGPFQVVGYNDGLPLTKRWYTSSEKHIEVSFPKGAYDKISLNPGYLFPEFNDRDNTLRTQGFFKNKKKIQLKVYSDIENPEYTQIFMNPQIRWNNYDKFLIGMKFHNQSLLTRPYKWNISPKFSTGTGKLAGGVSLQNTFTPQATVFRSIRVGGATKFEHYDKDLSYFKWSLFADVNFKKDPRAALSHGFIFSYDNLDKEVPKFEIQTDENKYSLWNLTYYYSRPDYIHESHGSFTFQTTAAFQKLYGEIYYRWRFAPKKQIGTRVFAASFINNKADTDYFNFGLSRVSDYAFNLNMLGRSESSGLLSQQYFLAEAGFKSIFEFTINQWIVGSNVEIPVWKIIDVYADAAVYKNKYESTDFIYDTGIRVKVIPDFLEFYLPVQSSLGFEPAQDKYWEKVRFTLNVNLGTIINYLRRGWY